MSIISNRYNISKELEFRNYYFCNLNERKFHHEERKRFTPEQKIIILRELHENNLPISQVAEKYNVHVNDIYNWKKKLFENGTSVFESKSTAGTTAKEKKIENLDAKLQKNTEAIISLRYDIFNYNYFLFCYILLFEQRKRTRENDN